MNSRGLNLEEYRVANLHNKIQTETPDGWWKPPSPLFKVNVDGAVFATQNKARVGVIIRDAQGLVIAAFSKKIKTPLGAIEIEAKAYEYGV